MNARILLSLMLCLGAAVASISAHDACSHESCESVEHKQPCSCPCDDCEEEGCEGGKHCHKCDVND